MYRLRLGSLFSGIGGFDLAFARVGFDISWQVEIDPAAVSVLGRHFPHVKRFGDVRDVSGEMLPSVYVITAGFPCQDLSLAGRRAGLSGERSGLFFEVVRIVREMRRVTSGRYPAFLVLENVPGLLSTNRGGDFALVLHALADSGAVDIAWRVLDASCFGLPQRRRRVFIVVDFRGERAGKILFDAEGGGGNSPAGGAPGSEDPGTASDSSGRSRLVGALTAHYGAGGPDDNAAQAGLLVIDTPYGYSGASVTAKWAKGSGGPSGDETQNIIVTRRGVRRITPREAERLQGFPDDWTRWRADGQELPDTVRYRLIGNAVAVPVARWLARRIMHYV